MPFFVGWMCGKTKVEVMDKLWWQESWNPWMMDAETKVADLEEQNRSPARENHQVLRGGITLSVVDQNTL